jgi:hypothetical protein
VRGLGITQVPRRSRADPWQGSIGTKPP